MRLVLTLAALAALASTALASAAPASDSLACGPDRLEQAVLARVSPEGDMHLADGRVLRLAGLHGVEAARLPARPGDRLAIGLLGEPDRWSRLPALVFALPEGAEPVWLQQHLAASGAAAIRPDATLGGCWTLLQAAEASARSRPVLAVEPGRFARVEGRVSRIGEGRTAHFLTVYDNAGQRVTGLIQKRDLRRITQGGVDVAALKGHIVRLRGVRSLRNPQVIALTRADQIEMVR
jgi:hypothetical protein